MNLHGSSSSVTGVFPTCFQRRHAGACSPTGCSPMALWYFSSAAGGSFPLPPDRKHRLCLGVLRSRTTCALHAFDASRSHSGGKASPARPWVPGRKRGVSASARHPRLTGCVWTLQGKTARQVTPARAISRRRLDASPTCAPSAVPIPRRSGRPAPRPGPTRGHGIRR